MSDISFIWSHTNLVPEGAEQGPVSVRLWAMEPSKSHFSHHKLWRMWIRRARFPASSYPITPSRTDRCVGVCQRCPNAGPSTAGCVVLGWLTNPGASVFYCVKDLNMFLKRMLWELNENHGKVPLGASRMLNTPFIAAVVLISVTEY